MTIRLFLFGLLIFTQPLMGQLQAQAFASLPPCDCSVFDTGKRPYFDSEEQAGRVVKQLLESVQRNSRLTFNDRILVRRAACPSPVALLCPTRLPNGRAKDERVILYNNQFLESITRTDSAVTWIDRQVLAHEIGHHVFGDLVNEKNIEAVERLYRTEVGTKAAGLTKHQTSNLHAQELQADFFSLWLLVKTEKAFDFQRFEADFDLKNIRRIEQESGKNLGLTHPPFRERLDAMRQFWTKLRNDQNKRPVARLGYFADAASAAYVNLRPEKAYYDIALVAGLTALGRPAFRVDGAPVTALLYGPSDSLNACVGLSVSRFGWQRPLRIEGDIAWSQQRYGTTIGDGPDRRLLETFTLRYLLLYPKLTWSPVGRDRSNALSVRRLGFFIGVGPSVRLPLGFDYQNYAARIDPANQPQLQWSVSGRLSVGVELFKKTILPRGYKLALHYEPQRIRLRANPQPRMLSHTVDATLSYTFLRR